MLMSIQHVPDLFVDACLRNEKYELLFLSLIGRDTAMLQFFAAFSLKRSEGGFLQGETAEFTLHDEGDRPQTVRVPDVDALVKHTGRVPEDNLFGPLSHAWVYLPALTHCDPVLRQAWILEYLAENGAAQCERTAIWRRIKTLSAVPLLDHWCDTILDGLGEHLVTPLAACPVKPLGAIGGYRIHLPSCFARVISAAVGAGVLTESGLASDAATKLHALMANLPDANEADEASDDSGAGSDGALFDLGRTVVTAGIAALIERDPTFAARCLARHRVGDWGAVTDPEVNDAAVRDEERILSAYPIDPTLPCKGHGENTVWVITECDRSVTTLLLPAEY